jgi:hypothetical protein
LKRWRSYQKNKQYQISFKKEAEKNKYEGVSTKK